MKKINLIVFVLFFGANLAIAAGPSNPPPPTPPPPPPGLSVDFGVLYLFILAVFLGMFYTKIVKNAKMK